MIRKKLINRSIVNLAIVVLTLVIAVSLAGAANLPGKGVKVTGTYPGVAQVLFQLNVTLEGLKQLGYEIEPLLELEMVTMHVAVAQGDADLLTNHWDPIHNHLYEKVGGAKTVSKLGVIIEGALQGYLIDKATAEKYGITNIDQLKDPEIAKLFDADGDGKADLTGCNPGWGCERVIEHHMDAYGLRDTVEHVQGSYFALMADTISRYKQGQPILYYTWTPQWVSGILVPEKDTVWLTVPFTALPKGQENAKTTLPDGRNLGHSIVKIWTFANKEFVDANPPAKRFLELVKIPIDDINAQNLLMKNGEDKPEDIDRHVKNWISAHQAQFDAWVEEAAAAK